MMTGRMERDFETSDRKHYRVYVIGGVLASARGIHREDQLCFADAEGRRWKTPIGERPLESFSDAELQRLLRHAQGEAD